MKKKKILLLGDDLRYFSGVATMSKEIVLGTVDKYDWVQIGGAINQPDAGKIIDLSESVQKETGIENAYVKLYPTNGYGNMQLVRQIIGLEHPDAIFIFTDPRYWIWLFAAEREIRSKMPIIYLNIWDDLPYPMWNKPYYESCDGLLAISKQTCNINKQVLGDRAKEHTIKYVPHGVSAKFHPLSQDDPKLLEFKKNLFGDNIPKFLLLYNARNLGRKRCSDIILAWRYFCEQIPSEEAKECCLLMHTDIVDNAGTDLEAVCRDLVDLKKVNVKFFPSKLNTEDMNLMYNMSDGVILVSSNEGWGLSLTEALNTGKMIIATVSGGMQDQMRFEDKDGKWIDFNLKFPSNHTGIFKKCGKWAIPVFPASRAICGSPATPYIYDDRASIEDIAEAIKQLYKFSPEERQERGKAGYDWATGDEAGFTAKKMCERVIEGIEDTFKTFKQYPRTHYEIYTVDGERPSRLLDYNPVKYSYE